MFVSTHTEVVPRKLKHLPRVITVVQHLDLYQCERCGREYTNLRYDGQDKPSAAFRCLCQEFVSIN